MRGYLWRKMTVEERGQVLRERKAFLRPLHSPPHWENWGRIYFHITAACYEHVPFIGESTERLDAFSGALMETCEGAGEGVHAWCVLPNHYHLLVKAGAIKGLLGALGKLHGRTSFAWNGEEGCRGRKVFHRSVERGIRSEGHFWATMNYVHHNPVRHGYVGKWQEWPWSSARGYLREVGEAEARRVWEAYPVREYGAGWDDAGL